MITCFDFGTTEPDALDYLLSKGYSIHIANQSVGQPPVLRDSTSFHPKVFGAVSPVDARVVVGSANITRRALTINTEAVTDYTCTRVEFDTDWQRMLAASVPLTPPLVAAYRQARATVPTADDEPQPPAPPTPAGTLSPLPAAVTTGHVQPSQFDAFWVQVGGPSGGSGNQLELPRQGHQFFTAPFTRYQLAQADIATLTIRRGSREWPDRKLTWHGNNGMERLNLPTLAQGGFAYGNCVVLFVREAGGFQLTVVPDGSPDAQAWTDESRALAQVYRFGPNSQRVCGFF